MKRISHGIGRRTLAAVIAAGAIHVPAAASGQERTGADAVVVVGAKVETGEAAAAIESRMNDAEVQRLLHSTFARPDRLKKPVPPGAQISASFTPGNPRLGIPALLETDASLGVAWVNGERKDGATALPSGLSLASSWSAAVAMRGSAMIAGEARAKGFNVLLAGGVNLVREPRNGRNFEYLGEDPLLSGVLGGATIAAIQQSHMISTVKHFALNAQETGRHVVNSVISEPAAFDSDLLAFRIAIERGRPGSVMCAYNRFNGPQACANPWLLDTVLKQEWRYPGFVMSDWGAVRDARDILKGLDRQSGEETDQRFYFAEDLPGLMASDPAITARARHAARRILWSMGDAGLFSHPPARAEIDFAANTVVAREAAEAGIVLLKNDGMLPLVAGARKIAVIGGYANIGVMSGGGSSQVAPVQGPSLNYVPFGNRRLMLHPSAPLDAIRKLAGNGTQVVFSDGTNAAEAAAVARDADVVLTFATQYTTEAADVGDLSLPSGQDALIAAVAAANPRTVVVLESGGPVAMPWADKVPAIVEAWYPGIGGGEAIANVLFGKVDPSGRLPVTFPASLSQLPRPVLDDSSDPQRDIHSQSKTIKGFDVNYNIEGSDVGYRWFARTGARPLFPFGHGLTYTTFAYSDLKASGGKELTLTFTLRNTGQRAGREVAQAYVTDRAGRKGVRLIGWAEAQLAPGESRNVTIVADRRVLGDWSVKERGWRIPAGSHSVFVGRNANDPALTTTVKMATRLTK